jgi:hypothetical protein
MIVPDVNLLVYSYNQHARVHAEAREWWERTLSSPRPVGLAWAVALGFIRIVTNPRVFHHAVDHGVAIRTVRQWLAVPVVQFWRPAMSTPRPCSACSRKSVRPETSPRTRIWRRWRSSIRLNSLLPTPISPGFRDCAGSIPSSPANPRADPEPRVETRDRSDSHASSRRSAEP